MTAGWLLQSQAGTPTARVPQRAGTRCLPAMHPEASLHACATLPLSQEFLAIQNEQPRNVGFFGTRNMGFMHQQLIEVLSYAMLLTVSPQGGRPARQDASASLWDDARRAGRATRSPCGFLE